MYLSKLQKFILIKCLEKNNGLRADFYCFYPNGEIKKGKKTIREVIHRSLERLVAKDLLVAFGRKTAKKWFIQRVKLTARGRRLAKELVKSRQRKLPIK